MTDQEFDRRNSKIGLGVSISIHMLLAVFFFLLLAWKEPFPPIPEYGIELSFGLEEVGSGTISDEEPAKSNEREETETATESTPTEETIPLENEGEVVEKPQSTPLKTEPVKEEIKKEDPKPIESTPKIIDPVKLETKTSETTGQTTDSGKGIDNKSGTKGDPTVDSRAIYGSPNGTGSSLELSGWTWDSKPTPKDASRESGRIVFQVTIDENGDIIQVKTLEKTVTPAVEKIYKDAVFQLTFSKTSDYKPAPQSVGKITFIIKAN